MVVAFLQRWLAVLALVCAARSFRNGDEATLRAVQDKPAPTNGTAGGTEAPSNIYHEPSWLFVLGTGRSGSTTILDMLSLASPSIWLAGENGGVMNTLHDQFQFATEEDNGHKGSAAWKRLDLADSGMLLKDLHKYVRDFLGVRPADLGRLRYVGFKEIRAYDLPTLRWYDAVFPRAKFVLNWRENTTAQALSGFHGEKEFQHEREKLEARNRAMASFATELPAARAFRMRLEDFSADRFDQLVAWLGFQGCSFARVLHDNDSGSKWVGRAEGGPLTTTESLSKGGAYGTDTAGYDGVLRGKCSYAQ